MAHKKKDRGGLAVLFLLFLFVAPGVAVSLIESEIAMTVGIIYYIILISIIVTVMESWPLVVGILIIIAITIYIGS